VAILEHRRLRRLITIPAALAGFVVLTLLFPVLAVVALVSDRLGRRRLIALRTLAMVELYLACEVMALAASTLVWVSRGSAGSSRRRYLALQGWWARVLFRGAVWIYSLEVEFDVGGASGDGGPALILVRHTSQLDTLLPLDLIAGELGLDLGYVVKRELLLSPSLDIIGSRLRNAFVLRDGTDTDRELGRLREMATGIGDGEGLVIFPEGTLYSEETRRRALDAVGRVDEARASRFAARMHTLPPRRGGVLAVLEAAPEADVVVVVHTGLEGIATFRSMLWASLVGRRVEVAAWRVPRGEMPEGAEQQVEWLDEEWGRLDRWVGEHRVVEAVVPNR
jgi:1-acyl-sn-glycerol-3-phosphate acyltransferase